jgi:cytochrome c-type biogenesis protein CcmF
MNLWGTFLLRGALCSGIIGLGWLIFRKGQSAKPKPHPGLILGFLSGLSVLTAAGLLSYALINGQFQIKYVFEHTEKSLPLIYKISALWAGSSGSLLLWAAISSVFSMVYYWKCRDKELLHNVFLTLLAGNILFLMITNFNNPFSLTGFNADGFSLNPALQSIGMVFHPPMVIISYSCFFMALAHLITGISQSKPDPASYQTYHRWTSAGWIILSAGVISGGLWAYRELGWGGYWAWDPIENSALITWLLATIALHSGNVFRKTSAQLIISLLIIISIILGTFLARSGILKSVHAYSNQNHSLIFGFVVLFCSGLFGWMILRRRRERVMQSPKSSGSSETEFYQPKAWRRQLSNIEMKPAVIVLFVMAGLIGGATVYPLYAAWFTPNPNPVPASYYDLIGSWSGFILIVLIGIHYWRAHRKITAIISGIITGIILVLLLPFPKDDYGLKIFGFLCGTVLVIQLVALPEAVRRRGNIREIGRIIIHLALPIIALGIIGSRGMVMETAATLSLRQTMTLGGYRLSYQKLRWRETPAKTSAVAMLAIDRGKFRRNIQPALTYYRKRGVFHSRAYIHSAPAADLYVLLENITENNSIIFRVKLIPLMALVWLGCAVLISGAVVSWCAIQSDRSGKPI